MLTPAACSDGPIWDVWLAAFHVPTLAVADELGMFSAMRDHDASPGELATSLGIELRATESMLGLMTALGFLVAHDGRFALAEVARTYLLPDSPYYWGGFLRRVRAIPIDCNKLIDSLRRGNAAHEARVSGALWRAPAPPPEALVSFTHAMHAHSFALATRVVPKFPLDGVKTFLDVAGGSGSYSIAAALRDPALRCTILDLPAVCDVSRSYSAKLGVAAGVTYHPANMFSDPWPTGFDAAFFSDIFHDWDDEQCAWLAARAFDALAPGGQVLVHEMILDDAKTGPLNAIAYSMVMVFVTEGRQRSQRELTAIVASAGFVDIVMTMTAEGYAVISGRKPA
jgi:cyclopropane fatty-acyl-phospholipid synthase-like methyltransferase